MSVIPHIHSTSITDGSCSVCDSTPTKPDYVYVASSWRNPMQPAVCAALTAARIAHYDFRNPPGGTGFSWKQVKTENGSHSTVICEHCSAPIAYARFTELGFWEPDLDVDPKVWRHVAHGYAGCNLGGKFASPKKGSDWEQVDEYLRMIEHPLAIEGYGADYAAMDAADTFILVLPCGKSAHLELGWAVGAGKRTAILLEDPVEPELMYRMVDYLASSLFDLLGWLGVED